MNRNLMTIYRGLFRIWYITLHTRFSFYKEPYALLWAWSSLFFWQFQSHDSLQVPYFLIFNLKLSTSGDMNHLDARKLNGARYSTIRLHD